MNLWLIKHSCYYTSDSYKCPPRESCKLFYFYFAIKKLHSQKQECLLSSEQPATHNFHLTPAVAALCHLKLQSFILDPVRHLCRQCATGLPEGQIQNWTADLIHNVHFFYLLQTLNCKYAILSNSFKRAFPTVSLNMLTSNSLFIKAK